MSSLAPRPSGSGGRSSTRLVLLTRELCGLCQEAEPVARAVAADVGLSIEVVDIDSTDGQRWRHEFTDQVPVVLLDDRPIATFRMTTKGLRRAVRAQLHPVGAGWRRLLPGSGAWGHDT